MERSDILSADIRPKRKFKVHYAWIYVTERCNLGCDYCYFKHKQERDISFEDVQRFFSLLEREGKAPRTLILSGGEVFLAKERLFRILEEARRCFKGISLHVQTNGSLIDKASIDALLKIGVSLEFGIDGACEQTVRHRQGLDAESFKSLTDNIRSCLKAGISCGCTMTVHPDEVCHMEEGLRFIQELGFSQVDVTPAAFMPWTPEAIALFKKTYLAIAREPHLRKLFYVYDDAQGIERGAMDLSLHPSGHLLGGDPFLCLPEEKRKQFNLWDETKTAIRSEVLSFYQDAYGRMYDENERALYREHLCCSFDLVNTMMEEKYMNAQEINDMLCFLTQAHGILRRKEQHG